MKRVEPSSSQAIGSLYSGISEVPIELSMAWNVGKLNPGLALVLSRLKIDPGAPVSQESFEKLLQGLNEMLNDIDLDRDLLEKSLKLASDEMQDQFHQVAQTAKMASLGEMAGNIAHEINNPLQVLITSAQMISRKLSSSDNFDQAFLMQKAKTIEEHTRRIATIVRGLRTISRDGSNDGFSKTNLQNIMKDTISLCQGKLKSQSIELRLPQQIPDIEFYARASQIEQVLLNLLNNAYDAISEEPRAPQGESFIEISILAEDLYVEFRVRDSGQGVPAELENKIMQPFFTTKAVGKGTGLGLSVSAAIAKDHGGFLKMDRQISDSCFVLRISRLPRENLSANPQQKKSA